MIMPRFPYEPGTIPQGDKIKTIVAADLDASNRYQMAVRDQVIYIGTAASLYLPPVAQAAGMIYSITTTAAVIVRIYPYTSNSFAGTAETNIGVLIADSTTSNVGSGSVTTIVLSTAANAWVVLYSDGRRWMVLGGYDGT